MAGVDGIAGLLAGVAGIAGLDRLLARQASNKLG